MMRAGVINASLFLSRATALPLSASALLLLLAAGSVGHAGESESGPTAEQVRFFERSVRPVLAENCYKCHGPQKQKGGLRLDSREAILTGGDSGPAIEPGKPAESLLIEAVHYDSVKMPPSGQLPQPAVAARRAMGQDRAPWPGNNPASQAGSPAKSAAGSGRGPRFSDEDRAWWAFQPVREPTPPVVDDQGWSARPARPLPVSQAPSRRPRAGSRGGQGDAHPPRYLRRDRPAADPQEIDAFLADHSPNAYETLIDRLLASPQYGQRWARHWLDLVRYAESDGYRIDHVRPQAWHYPRLRHRCVQRRQAVRPVRAGADRRR